MIEILDDRLELNFRQRWASYLTIAVAIAGLLGGLLLRNNMTNATVRFENKQSGIAVRYPVDWLLEQGQDDFVIRVQDPAATPFKTTLQISLQPIGEGARVAYILDLLNIDRAATLSAYRPLEIVPITLPNGSGIQGTQMTYAYVATESNPFLQTVPIVVRAIDVVVIRSSQAIIVTYQADAQSFERNRHYFDTLLRTLEL
ncbi:MAG: hypothetical protein IT324_07725 [Anaerolineae bacterium]|nr:hypothetical protein [Anaerolineae bacterium]